MPLCAHPGCSAEVVSFRYCGRHRTNEARMVNCRLCGALMSGVDAICAACGATGNPLGVPPPAHLMLLCQEALTSRREKQGPVLLVCKATIPLAYIRRVFRENLQATEVDIKDILLATPTTLPPRGTKLLAAFIDRDIGDPSVRELVDSMVCQGPPPSVWEWLKRPVV